MIRSAPLPVLLALMVGAVALALRADAATVHRWIDADGVTHFSDQPPPEDARAADVLELASPPEDGGRTDYYSIANQWQRVREERMAREQLNLERRYLDQLERQGDAPPEAPPPAATVPLYYPPAGRIGGRPGRHGFRDRPGGPYGEHPVAPADQRKFHVKGNRPPAAQRAPRPAGRAPRPGTGAGVTVEIGGP